NSVATLLCLRYGIEWQIWYHRMPVDRFDVRICDMAACRVTARFYELIPQEDKEAIDYISTDIADVIRRFSSDAEEDLPVLDQADFDILGELHNQNYEQTPMDPGYLEVLRE